MPPKTERSSSLPTNKPPRISTRSRATAHTHPTPQHTSTPSPLTFTPVAATRRNSDSQPAMPSQSQESDHQLPQEELNTPRASVSSPTTTTTTTTSSTTPSTTTSSTTLSSSSARPVLTRRDTRTNRRTSQSSPTNTVSPGPSDPQPSEQPTEERARSATPVSEAGELLETHETHETRMPTRSRSADSSVAEPPEDPSQPGGRRKSTRLTAPVIDPAEGETAPDINVTKRRKGGRGLARANGVSAGRAKIVAEYDESDDSETEVTAPKLTREEKKARREALLQERFAELDTMQRQIEGGTHPSFIQELDDIEAKRKRKLQIAETRLAYSKVSINEFLQAAEKQAFDDFAFGRLALRRSMLEDVQRKITSLHNELIKLKFPKNPSERPLDEEGAEDYPPNIRPFMINILFANKKNCLREDEIEADLALMHEIPIDDYRDHRSHRHRRHRDRDRDRDYELYMDQEPDYEYEDDDHRHHQHYGYMPEPEPEPQPVYRDYEPDPIYDGREYEYGLLQELSRERPREMPREMYYDPPYDGDYYGASASTSTAPYMHRGDSYASYNNDRESFVESSSEEISPTPAPPTFYQYYPPPDARYAPSSLPPPPPPPPEASSSSSSIKRKHKHRSRDLEREQDKRQRYEEASMGEQDGYHEGGHPFYYVEDEDDRVRDEDLDLRHNHKNHNTHRIHRHSSSSMDRRPSWSESFKKKKKHRKDKFAVPVMVGSD